MAIVSDIHGNLTAFEAVLADLSRMAPDVILHGGDLADSGSSPAEIVDRIRELGWPGVAGNTDELLFAPETLTQFAAQSPPAYQPMFAVIEEMAAVTRERRARNGWPGCGICRRWKSRPAWRWCMEGPAMRGARPVRDRAIRNSNRPMSCCASPSQSMDIFTGPLCGDNEDDHRKYG